MCATLDKVLCSPLSLLMSLMSLNSVRFRSVVLLLIIVHFHQSFGQTINEEDATCQQHELTDRFHARRVQSGPIFLCDKRTIFISRFVYSHNGINNVAKASRWFKATTHDDVNLVDLDFIQIDGTLAPAELKRNYQEENVYLRVNNDITQFKSLVIANNHNDIMALVNFTVPDGIDLADSITNPMFEDNNFVFRYPKCCPIGYYAGHEGCTVINKPIGSRIPIFEANNDEFNNESMINLVYRPFYNNPECHDIYMLDPSDEVYMLSIGRMISALPHFACLDFIDDENGFLSEQIFMCAVNNINTELTNSIYVGLMYCSAGLLIIWAVVLAIMLSRKQLTSKTIIVLSMLYSFFYALHFITLATARQIGVVSDTCKIMGYIYQFLLLSSFTALFALIFEGFYRVKNYNKQHVKVRIYFYIGFCAVPIVTTLVSVFTNEMTLSGTNELQRDAACWLKSERKVYSYYVPIIIIIVCCMMIQIKTYFDIKEKHRTDPVLFTIEETKFKNMFRLGAYLNFIMTLCWLMELLAYCLEAQNNFWFVVDSFNSMQGLAIFIAFSYHFYDVWKKFIICTTSPRSSHKPTLMDVEMKLMPK